MRRPRITVGGWGWIGVAGVVVTADGIALWREATGRVEVAPTMSRSFWLSLCHPVRRWPTAAAWAGITVHLCSQWNDPIRRTGAWVTRRASGPS